MATVPMSQGGCGGGVVATQPSRWAFARLPNISKYCVSRVDLRVFVRLVPRVRHAHAFDRTLRDAIDHHRRLDAGGFEDRRHDVDDVVELRADAASILDVAVSSPR